jgi:hypothetical protein
MAAAILSLDLPGIEGLLGQGGFGRIITYFCGKINQKFSKNKGS